MSRIVVYDTTVDPPRVMGRVLLSTSGKPKTSGPAWLRRLITKPAGHTKVVTPKEGGIAYLRALEEEYSGSAMRAVLED
jgi:hypothetical protein